MSLAAYPRRSYPKQKRLMTISLWALFALVTAAVAIVDAIVRVRGKRGNPVIAIVELVAAVLLAISLFYTFPGALTSLLFSVVLEVALLLILAIRGSGARRAPTLTIIALVLNTVLALHLIGWLTLPFMGR